MIHEIEIRNFRCFRHFVAKECRRINVIVGDSGAGKTALLEALFLTLSGNLEISIRFRAQRGLDGGYSGVPSAIEEAIWQDYFYDLKWDNPIIIQLEGTKDENRSLIISRGAPGSFVIPLADSPLAEPNAIGPLTFQWRNSKGELFTYSPKISQSGIQLETSAEALPDYFMFSATQVPSSAELAARFSTLSRAKRHRQFVELFIQEYAWIEDLSIQVSGGLPQVHANVQGLSETIPLATVSGGMNRIANLLLTMASRARSVVLVDEMENGVYHKHQLAYWRSVLTFAREFDSQLFVTTHSEEWIAALFDAANGNTDDIAFWRLERAKEGPVLRQFSGKQAKAAVATGEVR